jgi:hypothetical protein
MVTQKPQSQRCIFGGGGRGSGVWRRLPDGDGTGGCADGCGGTYGYGYGCGAGPRSDLWSLGSDFGCWVISRAEEVCDANRW